MPTLTILPDVAQAEEVQRSFERARRKIKEHISAKDFRRLEQMSSFDHLVKEGNRISNELRTKSTSSSASKVGNLALGIEPYARILEGFCKLSFMGGDLIWGIVSFLLVVCNQPSCISLDSSQIDH